MLTMSINKNGFENLPILSHIQDNLYVGVSPAYWPAGEINFFSTVFNLFVFEEYLLVKGQIRHDIRMYDDNSFLNRDALEKIARQVVAAYKAGPTLVHCQMGINRSNLIAGLALIQDKMPANDAILLLRAKRSEYALTNPVFEAFLRTYP